MRFVVLACIFEALLLRIRQLNDLSARVVEMIVILLLADVVYLISCYFVLRHSDITKSVAPSPTSLILPAAVLFRLTLWSLAPTLTDDPFRYRWEGKLQAAGGNPYQARPVDPQWARLRDAAFPRVVGKDFKAVYGPLIEQLELWAYRVVSRLVSDPIRQVFWFKLPYALCDLGVLAVLWRWLGANGLPGERVLIYAWSPLPVLAFWADGHNDSLPLLLMALAFLAAARRRWTWAFVSLSLATAAKIWPALLFPLFIGWQGRRPQRWYQWWVFIPICGVLAWPYWGNIWENARFLSGFVGGWRNNDSLFGLVLWLAKDIYLAKKIAFGIVLATLAGVTVFRFPLEQAALCVVTVTLMVSSNCHPWYMSWILPLLAFQPVPALLLWSALVPLAYSVVIDWTLLGQWHGSTAIRWYEYVPVYGLLVATWLLGRRSRPRAHDTVKPNG